jgi:hypothetical protein
MLATWIASASSASSTIVWIAGASDAKTAAATPPPEPAHRLR